MKLFCLAVVLSVFLQAFSQNSERYTISGYVREAVSRETLIGVNIYLSDRKTGTVTNTYGFFSLTLPAADSLELIVSYVGFTPEIVKVSFRKNTELNIDLKPSIILNEVEVTANFRVFANLSPWKVAKRSEYFWRGI